MAGTRSSPRKAANDSHSSGDDTLAGSKRKPETEPSPKRDRKAPKKQATLEETLGDHKHGDHEMKDAQSDDDHDKRAESNAGSGGNQIKTTAANGQDDEPADEADTEPSNASKKDSHVTGTNKEGSENTAKANGSNEDGAVQESSQREKEVPSNILEKGVIYFFTRNRVGIDDADSVGDLQRTFFVLRPLPIGAKLGDGAVQDLKNNRLFALPKKTFPKSHSDRFMAFVEKANSTIQDLKDNFMKGSEYETKTQGTRKVDPVTPVAEGVYVSRSRTLRLIMTDNT